VVVTQIDKLILSTFLDLKNFGYYTLAVTVSGVILILSAPLSQVLMPRLSALVSQKSERGYIDLYTKSFAGLSIIIVPLAVFMVFFAEKLLFIWTGDMQITQATYPLVKWLALGNAVAVLMNFIFLLQYSKGSLKEHLIAYVSYSFLLIPLSVLIVYYFKASGAVIFWFIHNIVFFIVWGGLVHRKHFTGVNLFIWRQVLLPCTVISSLYFILLKGIVVFYDDRVLDFFILFLSGISCVALLFGYFWFLTSKNLIKVSQIKFLNSIG